MEKLDKQDLAAVIKEMNSPLESADDVRNNSFGQLPTYEAAVENTETKRPVSQGDVKEADETPRKFVHCESEDSDSEGSESDTDTIYSIRNKIDLLKQIEKLQKEQDELRQKQLIHEKHIKELLELEPCVHKHFRSIRKSLSSETKVSLFNNVKNKSLLPMTVTNKQSLLTEEHIYVQLEQLYANFHVLRFPSKTAQTLLGGSKIGSYSKAYSMNEIESLKNKVRELEEKLTMSCRGNLSLPQPHFGPEGTLKQARSENDMRSTRLISVPGRPTSPLLLPPKPDDLSPVEVTFKWTIINYSRKLRQEMQDDSRKEISNPFYLTHCGYRAQVEIYLNGNGTGTNRCMSVFLRIIQGDYDRQLKWPVNLRLVVILVNQSGDQSDSLKAEGTPFQYKRPSGPSDGESDCWGLIEFVRHDMIKQRQYLSGDKVELKCRVQFL